MHEELKPTHCPPLPSTQALFRNEVKVTNARSRFFGQTGRVEAIMADGRSLDIEFKDKRRAFLDVNLVSEIQEPPPFAKGEPDLGPIANSVVQSHR